MDNKKYIGMHVHKESISTSRLSDNVQLTLSMCEVPPSFHEYIHFQPGRRRSARTSCSDPTTKSAGKRR